MPGLVAQLILSMPDTGPATRVANHALYTAVLCRMRHDPRTRAYVQRRTKQGLTKKEIIRCLKRYVVREAYTALLADFTALTT